ncbi:MAG: hypothetical protein QW531_05620 [Thermoplasmata archaeon]
MSVGFGAKAILKYGWSGEAKNKVFGQGQTITSFDRENNIEGLYTLGIRNWNYHVAKQYAVRIGVEWILSNPWIFKAILGKGETSGTSPPYTHTFTAPDPESDGEIASIDIVSYIPDQGLTTITNAKVATCRIAATQSEPARMACDLIGTSDSLGAVGTDFIADTFEPYTFAQAELKYYSGGSYVTVGYVRSIEINYSNELEVLYALGQRTPTKLIEKNLVIGGRMSIILNDNSNILKRFYGSVNSTAPETKVNAWNDIYLTFTKTANEYIEIKLGKIVLNTYSLPQSPTDVIVEDVEFVANTMTVTAKNDTSSIP